MSETNNKGVKVLASASLLFVTIIWGSAFVVMKNSMDSITPTYLLAYRFTIAALGMAALFWKQIRGMSMQEFKCGALAGLFLFISYYFQTYGLKYTTASKNAFITTLYVVIVPFLAWAVNHVRPKANNLIAAGFAVVGLALLSLKGDLSVNFGDFLTLVCGICFAVHMIFLDRFTAYCTPIRLTVMQMGTAAFVGAGASHGRSVPSGSIYTAGSSSFDAVSGTRIQHALFSASDSGAEISERQHILDSTVV